ncbi:MAG: hypothetical protein JXR03_08170 [Cyclobacteriaceae bacterium]
MKTAISILLAVFIHQVFAFEKVDVTKELTLIELRDYSYRYTDTTKLLSVSEIAQLPSSSWKKGVLDRYSTHHEWALLTFVNTSSEDFNKVLFLNNHFIHEADFYFVVDGVLQQEHVASGLARSKQAKLYNDPMYPVKVHFPANSEVKALVRIYDPLSTIHSPFFLMSDKEAMNLKDTRLLFSYLWVGILLLSLTLALFMYISIRQKIFLHYIFLGIATGIIITANIGVLSIFIDSDPFQFVTNYYQIGAVLLIMFMPRFLNCIVPISSYSSWAWKGVKIIGYLAALLALLNCIPAFKLSLLFTSFIIETLVHLSSVVFLYLLVMLFIAAYKREELAITLFIVYLIYLGLAFGVVIAPFLGVDNEGLNTFYLMLGGSVFETVSFMLLMAQVTLSIYNERDKLNRQVQSYQETMMNAIVKGQEAERKRFAEDLHDGFGQMISSLMLNLKSLETIKSSNTDKRMSIFKASTTTLSEMYVELKNICFNLMPQTLIAAGVGEALKEFASRINQSQKIVLEVSLFNMESRLTQVQEISLYRISQEWINNIIKYSDATKIHLQITRDETEATLMIEDNGAGFDKSVLTNGNGNGWKNICSRVNLIKGEVDVETSIDLKGSSLIVNTPISISINVEESFSLSEKS